MRGQTNPATNKLQTFKNQQKPNQLLELHGAAVEMRRRDFFAGHWAPYLARAAGLPVCYGCACGAVFAVGV
jgi:hypothetical protein